MHVYADESDTFGRNGYLCIAGLMATDDQWNRLHIRWENKLKEHRLRLIHTSDLLSGKGDHKDLGGSFEERLGILNEFMDIVRDEISCGWACEIDARDYRGELSFAKKKVSPEEFLFRRLLARSFEFMAEVKSVEPISVWLDDSEKTSSRLLSVWTKTKKNWPADKSMLACIAFGDDKALPPLQAADIYANVMTRGHADGLAPWNGKSPYNRLFIDPQGPKVSRKFRCETWTADEIGRLSGGIVRIGRPQ